MKKIFTILCFLLFVISSYAQPGRVVSGPAYKSANTVYITETGVDLTGEVDNINKPFLTWDAAIAASTTEGIFIDGNFTGSTTRSGAVNVHFAPGSSLTQSSNTPLFSIGDGESLIIRGKPNITTNLTDVAFSFINSASTDELSSIDLELGDINMDLPTQTTYTRNFTPYVMILDNMQFKADKIIFNGSNFFPHMHTNVSNFEVDEFVWSTNPHVGETQETFLTFRPQLVGGMIGSYNHVKIGTYRQPSTASEEKRGLVSCSTAASTVYNKFYLDVEVGYYEDLSTQGFRDMASDYASAYYDNNIRGLFTDSRINYTIDEVNGNGMLSTGDGVVFTNSDLTYSIKKGLFQDKILEIRGQGTFDASSSVKIKCGDCVSTLNTPIGFHPTANNGVLEVEGSFENQGAQSVIYSNSNFDITGDTKLIVANPTTPAISSSVPITVTVYGCYYTNSTVTDPNVTMVYINCDPLNVPNSTIVYKNENGVITGDLPFSYEKSKDVLVSPAPVNNSYFGAAIAINGDLAMASQVSGNGNVYLFENQDDSWNIIQTITGTVASGQFGFDLEFYDRTAIISAPVESSNTGSFYVHDLSTGTQIGSYPNPTASTGDLFGREIDISNGWLFASAPTRGANIGAVEVYQEQIDGSWLNTQTLTAFDAATNDRFGWDVAINDNYAIIGAYGDDASLGAVYFYKREGSNWTYVNKYQAGDGVAGDQFGVSVEISNGEIIIGADQNGGIGAVYRYSFNDTGLTFIEKIVNPYPTATGFGGSLDMNGRYILIGSPASAGGAVHAYERKTTGWSLIDRYDPNAPANGEIGWKVKLSGGTFMLSDDGINSGQGEVIIVDNILSIPSTVNLRGFNPERDNSGSYAGSNFIYSNDNGTMLQAPFGKGIVNDEELEKLTGNRHSKTYYVSELGSDANGEYQSILKPFATPQAAAHDWDGLNDINIHILKGEYEYTGPYTDNTDYPLSVYGTKEITYTGEGNLTYSNTVSSTQTFINDGIGTGFPSSSNPARIVVDMPNSLWTIKNIGTSTGSITRAISVTDALSSIRMRLRRLDYPDGLVRRTFGVLLASPHCDVHIDSLTIHGQTGVQFGDMTNASGFVFNSDGRRLKFTADYVQADFMQTSNPYAYYRMQTTNAPTPAVETNGEYIMRIGKHVEAPGQSTHTTLGNVFINSNVSSTYQNYYFEYSFGEVDLGDNIQRSVFSTETAAAGQFTDCEFKFHIGKLRNCSSDMYWVRSTASNDVHLRSKINWSGDDIEFTLNASTSEGGQFDMSSKQWDDCDFTADFGHYVSALTTFDFDAATSIVNSRIKIKGDYENTGSGQPVIDLDDLPISNVITLENLRLTNDGTVAAIQSSIPRTVFVRGYLETNSTIQDSDITFVRLDENNPPLPSFADDAAAGVGGLTAGKKYVTDGTGAAPLNVAGIIMVKQ